MNFILRRSLEKQTPISMFYMDRKGNITERIIRVEKINEQYIQAYCYWIKERRVFSTQNILSVGAIKQKQGA